MPDEHCPPPTGVAASTGPTSSVARLATVHFGRYTITVRLGPGGEFLGIQEVAVNKDFLSAEHQQSSSVYDVADLYKDD